MSAGILFVMFSSKFEPCSDCATGHSRKNADVSCQHRRDRTNGLFPHGVVCRSTKSQQWFHFSPRQSINQRTLDTAEAMQVQHVSTGEKEPTALLHLKLLPDPQQHTRDSTPHAVEFTSVRSILLIPTHDNREKIWSETLNQWILQTQWSHWR